MARLPFFESTWRRKARLTGILLGVYVCVRLIALGSENMIGLGWGDIPVSLLTLLYLAFLYVEVWIIMERHTRPLLSVVAAALLAGLCVASPFIAFDPVSTGSIPDRRRFWEPTMGLERGPEQKIVLLQRSFIDEPVAESRRGLDRARKKLFQQVGLQLGSDELSPQEREQVLPRLQALAASAGLPDVRSRLWASAALAHLGLERASHSAELVRSRVACLEALVQRREQDAAAEAGAVGGRAPAGKQTAESAPLPASCEAQPAVAAVLTARSIDAAAYAELGSTRRFLDKVGEDIASLAEQAGPAKESGDGVSFRLGPLEHEQAGFAGLVTALQGEQPPAEDLLRRVRALPSRADRYSSALQRYLRAREEADLLQAQLALIPEEIAQGLQARRRLDGSREWQLADGAALASLLSERDSSDLRRWLDVRPREVRKYAQSIEDPERRAIFLHYMSQTLHWHLRDPDKIMARLALAEDEFRSEEVLGEATYPPVHLCRAMEQHGVDAAVLQLASLDRRQSRHLMLTLVQRDPCLVVWDHDVPIYEQADLLASTAEDGQAMSVAAADFFAPSLLGTDYLGKDMLMQLVKGTEGFFLPGLLAVAIGLGLGVLLGAFAGYMGGQVDKIITFGTTLVGSFPRLVFILLVCTIPESPSMTLIGGITGALFIPQVAEAVRRRVLALKAEDFIVASRAHGLSLPRILFYHMVWLQCFPEIVRQALYLFVYVIFLETALSYLEGPGAPPEIPSWGRMLANATAEMFRGQYWHALVPTAAIVFTTLGVASLGDVIVGQAKEERL